ncbi:hypothetical protein JTE90_016712 [Oedothorax gibbosus]|uniref:Uncharacterized protein n=1 Tax=Oedothorax gibbosus TaxID=931172 RepID=A0AAV6V1V4_9ARAC|nr:hypothetical protein JTE90_016712 [Oedothorax gibbosus]
MPMFTLLSIFFTLSQEKKRKYFLKNTVSSPRTLENQTLNSCVKKGRLIYEDPQEIVKTGDLTVPRWTIQKEDLGPVWTPTLSMDPLGLDLDLDFLLCLFVLEKCFRLSVGVTCFGCVTTADDLYRHFSPDAFGVEPETNLISDDHAKKKNANRRKKEQKMDSHRFCPSAIENRFPVRPLNRPWQLDSFSDSAVVWGPIPR